MLAGKIIPGEIRFFDKKSLVFIPTGDFDARRLRLRQGFRNNHKQLLEKGEHFFSQPSVSKKLKRKGIGKSAGKQCARKRRVGRRVCRSEAGLAECENS